VLRYRSIGDIILSNPTLDALRLTFPDARIDLVVDDVFKDICHGFSNINSLILHKRKREEAGKLKMIFEEIKFIWNIYRTKYDLVVDLHCGPRSAILTFLSMAPYRIGNKLRLRNKVCYNIFPDGGAVSPHSVDVMLATIAPLNPILPEKKKLNLSYGDKDRTYIKYFLSRFGIGDGERFVLIHPGARVDFKRLPASKMGEIIKWIADEYGTKVVLAGSNADVSTISDIAQEAGKSCLVATNLTIGQLSALIDLSLLFIGNDSGPMHMAAALKVPIIAFFGASDPKIWTPWKARGRIVTCTRMECMPCDQKGCKYVPNHCMEKIKMPDIKKAVKEMMAQKKPLVQDK